MKKKKSTPRILGIDYGAAKIGLALSDEGKKIAFPLTTITTGKNNAITIQNIKSALQENASCLDKIVIGLPIHMNGKESPMSEKIRLFSKELEESFQLEVILFDERLTSSFAERELKELSYNRKERAKRIDISAAAIILQNYLDAHAR